MNEKVQAALMARERRYRSYSNAGRSKVDAALEERQNNLASDVDEDYINKFMDDMNAFYSSAEEDYNNLGWSNASSSYDAKNSAWQDLSSRSSKVRSWLVLNRGKFDSDTYRNLITSLIQFEKNATSIVDNFSGAANYYGQWQTEDEYNRYEYTQSLINDAMGAEDFSDKSGYVSTKNDTLGNRLLGKVYDNTYEYINNVSGMRDELERKHTIYNWDNAADDGESVWKEKGYDLLTDDEVAVYNYYYATEGKGRAEEYLDAIQETLNYRKANGMFSKMEDNVALELLFGVEAGLDQFKSGVKNAFNFKDDYIPVSATQIASGMVRKDLGGDDDGFKILGNSIGQVGYDIINTTSNMLPSILTSTAANFVVPGSGAVIGAGMMGTSAAGNAYQEMLNLGYGKGQARAYSTLIGVAEGGLQYALGGISKLGGKVTNGAISKAISGIDNGLARFAIDFGASLAAEGIEEGLQEIISPLLKNAIFNTDEDIDWSQVAYSSLLGSLSAVGLDGVGTVASHAKYNSAVKAEGNSIVNNGGVESLVNLANEMAGVSNADVANSLSKRVSKVNGKNGVNAKAVGNLSFAVNENRVQQNKADIVKALESKGIPSKKAQKYADTLVSMNEEYFAGEKSTLELGTNAEWKKITGDANAYAVLRDVVTDMESSVNKRNNKYGYARQGINIAEDGKLSLTDENVQKATDEVLKPAYAKKAEGVTATVSEDGKAKVVTTDAEGVETTTDVTINGIDRIETQKVKGEDGKTTNEKVVYLKVADADGNESVVDMGNVKFSNRTDAVLYESFVAMDADPAHFDAFIKNFNEADYDGSLGEVAIQYALGFQNAYRYGWANMGTELGANMYASKLTDNVRNIAYTLGKETITKQTETKQKALDTAVAERKASGKGKARTQGTLHVESVTTKKRTAMQNAGVGLAKRLTSLGIDVYLYESHQDADGNWVDNNGEIADNGFFVAKDGSIHIDLNAGQNISNPNNSLMAYTLSHELVHFMRANAPAEFKVFADLLYKWYGTKNRTIVELVSEKMLELDCDWDTAYEEVVADSCESFLTDSNIADRIVELQETDKGTWEIIRDNVLDFLKWMKSLFVDVDPNSTEGRFLRQYKDEIDHLYDAFYNTLASATETFQWIGAGEVTTDAVAVEETAKHSYRSLAEAAGFEAREVDGVRGYYRNGQKVTEVTVDDIEISPIGAMINYSLDKGDITKEDAKRQKEMFAKICTLACKTNDFSMTMQFVGSAVFTGMKANADKQYGTTYDFPSICTKTQAVIDAMSKKMVSLKRGLSSEEILSLYQEVFASGNPVPCPECYVFSRWIGIGGLLDNIYEYQTHYGKMSSADAAKAYAELHKKVSAYASENNISFGKAKGALAKTITDKWAKLQEKIEKADNQGEKVKDSDRALLKSLENEMVTVKALTWLDKVYFIDNPLDSNGNPKANPKVNKNFAVPADVLFDLNKGDVFASKYSEAWGFRTTQGAGYGKAITPYAEAVLGEGILTTNNTSKTIKDKAQGKLNNPFLEQRGMMDKNAKKALDGARAKQKIQAFLGGQRFQSTSDARYENASDYLLAALEMQAMHGRVQVYTKVDGAVPAFGAWGFSINQSLMPLGGGLDAKGNIIDTKVGGMNPKVAFKNRENHETAGTITIGVNDNHIRKMFAEKVRDFIIPYHASGGKAWLVNAFRMAQDKAAKKDTFVRSTDYSRTQGDKVLSDTVLKWQGKTDAEIAQIHAVRDARLAILTGGKPNMDVVRGNRFLSALYDKFNGGEWDGVKIAKSKVESQIFPNEFWDESVTYEQSGKITQDYLDYCDALGFLHRFSGTVPQNGILVPVYGYNERGERVKLTDLAYQYDKNGNKTNNIEPYFWKVLTDRRMYGNDGQYLAQKFVTLNDTTESTVTNFAKKNDGRQYDAVLSMETADKVAGIKKSKRKSALETYTEEQYNAFGWASYNDVITAKERETLLSRFADFKHNRNKYPVTRWGEAVIHSTETPGVIIYVRASSTIKVPVITRIVRIVIADADLVDVEAIQEEVIFNEQEQVLQPYETAELIYGEEIFSTYQKRDCVSFQEYLSGEEGRDSGTTVHGSKELQDRERSVGKSNTDDRADGGRGGVKSSRRGNRDGNTASFDGTPFWSGSVSLLDGQIEEVHSFKEAEASDFHHSLYFSLEQQEKMDSGENAFFFVENGKIQGDWRETIPKSVLDRIAEQIDMYTDTSEIRYSKRQKAPTFYSYMGVVADGVKQDKLGAASVINLLKGKGVKDEEIKWSGIETWLDGKKSVTKAELQEFIAGSQLQIAEEVGNAGNLELLEMNNGDYQIVFDGDYDTSIMLYEEDGKWVDGNTGTEWSSPQEAYEHYMNQKSSVATRWGHYKLDGGENYREIVFTMPNSSYSNRMMKVHWGEDAEGILVHARIQDFDIDGQKMLFVEEIQSDWHNEGGKKGYIDESKRLTVDNTEMRHDGKWYALYHNGKDMHQGVSETFLAQRFRNGITDEEIHKGLVDEYNSVAVDKNNGQELVPDAPFRRTYPEYVMKRLIRMAAEEGYDLIGWTPSQIQVERWSDEFAEGYRIEYDQDIPKFLRKYGKKWGATVENAFVGGESMDSLHQAENTAQEELIEAERALEEARNGGNQDQIFQLEFAHRVAVDRLSIAVKNARQGNQGIKVWSMPITDSMKDSVLYEGQVMYQHRGNSTSNRSLLANALEGVAQNDIEARRLAEYKEKIDLINAEEKELRETRERIAELSFAKGPKDTVTIKNLQETATRIANRINTYDKQLLRLEATAPLMAVLEREKTALRKREKQKMAEAVAKYREKSAETLREVMKRNRESRERIYENRHKAEVRGKIKSYKAELERTLLNPTDRRYVPIDLIQAMVDVCDLIYTDTPLYKENGELNKAQERRNLTKERLQALKDEYENLKSNSDPMYKEEYDEEVYAYIKDLRENFGGKNLNDMSLDELTEMYHTLRSIGETLRDARKLIGLGDAESVYEAGDAIVAEQNAITAKRKKGKRSAAQKAKDTIDNYSLSPVRNVERMSGYNEKSFLKRLFNEFEKGIRNKNKFVMDSYKAFEHLTSGKEYDDAVYKEFGKEYTDINGREFRVSKMEMMQAILSHDREVANHKNHIQSGGFTFADLDMLRKGKLKEAISEENSHRVPSATWMAEEFRDALKTDKWCQEYMKVAREFFDGKAKDAINETSISLKHRIIAREKSYIPFEVDKNFIVSEISAENDVQQTINSYGMLKETKDGAPQPLIITGLNNILDRHIEQVGTVYGLAIPVRNFNKVWNVRSLDDIGNDPTVKAAIQRNWGDEGVKHIQQAVQDIQSPRHSNQSAIYKFVKSGYISSTFTLNLSVVTKQIGSLFSATSMLRWRDPVRMMGNLLYTMANQKKISAEVDKYTASAWMRRQGMSDSELYTLTTMAKKPGLLRLLSKAPAIVNPVKWITAMDHAVALSLWRYAKQDTAKKTGLKGEELLKATAEFYDEVIENTQSMTDVLHRPEVQKSDNVIAESFGMFKTDLYQMAGQLRTVAGRFQANKTAENGKALGRTVYSVLMSAVWGSLMTTAWALLRYKVDPYRDDEDEELTYESWLKRQGIGLLGDTVGYLVPLFGSEVVSAFENIKYGESDDLVDSIALTAINDLYDAMITIGTSVKDGEMPEPDKMKKYLIKALQVFKIPANNISRAIDAIKLHAEDIANGEFFSFEAGAERTPANEIHRIIERIDAGEYTEAKSLFDEIVEDMAMEEADGGEYGEDELKEAKSSLKTALGNKFKDGEVDEATTREILSELFELDEDDIYWTLDKWGYAKEQGSGEDYYKYDDFISAVSSGSDIGTVIEQYTNNGVEKDSLKTALGNAYKDGTLSKTSVERVLTKHFDMDSNDAYWQFDKWDYAKANGSTEGYSKYEEFHSAVESGRNLKDTIKRYTDHGVNRETLASQITQHFKPLYKEMSNAERANIKGYLLNAYALLGYNRADKNQDINNWLKD